MASKRILLASELSRGTTTAARLLPLALTLAERGHDITLALPPPVHGMFAGRELPVCESPVWAVPPPPGFVAVSYADLLQLAGYATPGSLNPLLDGWRSVLDQRAPDLLVADFAPTAMLTARTAGVKQAAVGDGYSLPVLARPMPPLRPWLEVASGATVDAEGRVLAVVEATLMSRGGRSLRALRDLFRDVPSYLCTFPELDHYPVRAGGEWFGEVFMPSGGSSAEWPASWGERIYVELDARHPAMGPLIHALNRLGLPTVVQGGGFNRSLAAEITGPTVMVVSDANREALIHASDIVVCQGSDVAAPALLNGKPVLMLPVFVEQMMTLYRIASQGMGHGIPADSDAGAVDAALRRLVDDSACRQHAANFGRRYDGYRPDIAVTAVADEIEDLLS